MSNSSRSTENLISTSPAFLSSGVTTSLSFATSTAKETSVGGSRLRHVFNDARLGECAVVLQEEVVGADCQLANGALLIRIDQLVNHHDWLALRNELPYVD